MYVGLHNHTEYSNITTGLDSINKLPDLIAKAKEFGMGGLAITNHDNLCEVIAINRIQKQLRAANDPFVLAIGNEIYLVDSFDPADKVRERYYHFILIAKDKIGYDALVELSSRAWYRSAIKRSKRRVPTLKADVEEIMQWAKGHLVASTACLGGEFAQHILQGDFSAADSFLSWCYAQFGEDDFYIELQPSESKDQKRFNSYVATHYTNRRFIITTDAHYQNKVDFPIFEAFLRSQQENREVQEYYDFARLMDEEEIFLLLRQHGLEDTLIREALNNTLNIGNQITFFDLAQDPKIPKVHLPDIQLKVGNWALQTLTAYPTLTWALQSEDVQTRYCIVYCLNNLEERHLWNDQYLSRLEEEFDTFKFQSEAFHDNFFCYFNTMQHFLELAWSIDCAVGPSRGSASGSLLCYLMDVVQCDPIQYNLPFWRFANKVRTSPLDIDTDFQPSKRGELFAAIRAERGELGLTQVATYRKLTLKAAIGNAGRGYRSNDYPNGLDPDITTYLSSLIEIRRGFVATLKQTLYGDETTGFSKNHTFLGECAQYPGLLDIIQKIEGLIVGSSTHAAAVILFDEQDKLQDHCSLMRAPNGDLCTALDLHTVEEAGCYKYDFLLLSTLDIQATCFHLLQKDNVIDPTFTLKQCFRTYINPNLIDFNNPQIWEKLFKNEVLSVFQWDAASGRKGILAAHPHNLFELTSLNGLIRLMTQEGEEDQIQRFVRIKDNPASFEKEMVEAGLDENQRTAMHNQLDQYNGCAATQESFMILSQELAGYSLKEADALRKTVAKKKMSEITAQKELFFSRCKGNDKVKKYLWAVVIQPSLGYGFSLNHALPYSIIGVQCILLGGILFPPIYWQAACLLQRSGALDGKSADYNKIAKAVSILAKQGVNIRPLDINRSDKDFSVDAEHNTIHYGLLGVKGIRSNIIDSIFANRPFSSMEDFLLRAKPDVTSAVALVKAGAFDDFCSRSQAIQILAQCRAGIKTKLNGQNLLMLSRFDMWPLTTKELQFGRRVFNLTQHLKSYTKAHPSDIYDAAEYYVLSERASETLDEIGWPLSSDEENGILAKSSWKPFYDKAILPMKDYLITNQTEMLDKVNNKIIGDWITKYFPGNDFGQWEIETMGLCFGQHPLQSVANVADFETLSSTPEIQALFPIRGRGVLVPIYRLYILAGIAIAKDKLHHTVTILTTTGPVDIKLRKEEFAHYDSQVSQIVDGKKKIIERSWFNRGVPIMVIGMREDDIFRAKRYAKSPMKHTVYRITGILPNGKATVQEERRRGEVSDDEES